MAPLAGWTDAVFRRICKAFGVGLIFTEMASADALVRDSRRTIDLVRFSPQERPIGIQLFGAEPETLARAAEIVSELRPDFIDINFGCPAKKVVRRGGGAALLRDLNLIEAIGRATVAATDIPVTAKLRSGWQEPVVVEACRRLQGTGIKAVTIHPRSQKMGFKGQSDWQQIAAVKQAISIPVIGNGDITCARDAKRMLDETGCDLVMVGRAARGNPWIFAQIIAYLQDGTIMPPPTFAERLSLCIHHLEEQERAYGAAVAVYTMRKHIACYLKGGENITRLRQQVFSKNNLQEVRADLLSYLKQLQQTAVTA
ncbi:tRNA dihydrouridine synthase DusB [candidate division KSB1 bacterium]|nr:tRNA dihydrouridine synthase DusB [candidate division KSB1 bacterium]